MEAIKITVNVNVELSENTRQFIQGLFTGFGPVCSSTSIEAEAPKAEAPKAETKKLDIEDLRVELKNKVNTHREAIKSKLTELGAPSVTKLAEDKYEEMYNFLIALPNE